MFIAGLKRLERSRGSGWLDCPNCHEHALQDVIDAMRFATVGFYRLMPVRRTRSLICRRCGYRREATDDELSHLETMGHPLRRAWFVPFGVIALLVAGALVYLGFASPSAGSTVPGISFVSLDGADLVHATLEVPNNWNTAFFTKPDDLPPPRVELQTTSTGLEKIVIARFTDSPDLGTLIETHFSDQTSLAAQKFPSTPPKAECVKVGGVSGALVKIPYVQGGATAEIIIYAFFHGPYGYTASFIAAGAPNITTVEQVAQHSMNSLKFLGPEPSPSASPGASGSPSAAPSGSAAPAASASAGASPSPGASGGAGASPSPSSSYTVSCS